MKAQYRIPVLILVVLMSLLLVSCDMAGQSAPAAGTASVMITSPADGSSAQPGQSMIVYVDSLVPAGVTEVMFEVNRVIVRSEPVHRVFEKGSLEIPWQPEEEGEYLLKVLLQSAGGDLFESNEVTVIVAGQPVVAAAEQQDIAMTETAPPTVTGTVTVSPTPTITPTATLGAPMATARQNINCRYGPAEVYPVTSGLHTDESTPIVGRNQDDSWWLVRDPYSKTNCWVLDDLVTTSGDLSQVPFVKAPPTPTPTFTPTLTPSQTPTNIPLTAPEQVSPSGKLKCMRRLNLVWNEVSHPDGISQYEWELDSSAGGGTVSGTTQKTGVTVNTTCSTTYAWRVRAYDAAGNPGPFSDYMKFSLD